MVHCWKTLGLEFVNTLLTQAVMHWRRNWRGHGAMGSSHFSAKIILKFFPFFLKRNFIRKTIHQDEEGTNLHRNVS